MSNTKVISLGRYITVGKISKCCFILVLGGCLICKLNYFTYIYIIIFQYLYALFCKHFYQVCIMLHVITYMNYFMCNKLLTFTAFVMCYSGHQSYLFVPPVKPLHFILMLAQLILCKLMDKYDISNKNILSSLFVLTVIPRCHKSMFRHHGHFVH